MYKYLVVLIVVLLIPLSGCADTKNKQLTVEEKQKMLVESMEKNDITLLEKAIAKGADVNQVITYTKGSDTPLTLAVSNGQFEIVSFLLDNGANVNAERIMPAYSASALVIATYNNDFEMVQLLLKHKADVNKPETTASPDSAIDDKTPLIIALGHTTDENPISLPLVRLLIKNGADVNKIDSEGYTPLMANANYSLESQRDARLQIAQELIDAGAEPTINDYQAISASQYAYDNNFEQMFEFLVKFQQN